MTNKKDLPLTKAVDGGIKNETLMPLTKAVKEETGRDVHLCTPLRWAQRGCRGVRLETVMLGGRRMTSRESVRRYIDAVTAASDSPQPRIDLPRTRSEKARKKSADRAAKQLADAGI